MSDVPKDAAPVPLTVETDLTLTVDGVEVAVESTGERLLVSFASVPDAVRVARHSPEPSTQLDRLLGMTDLTVEIRVRGRIVAVTGADARPGVLSQLLEVPSVEFRLGGSVGAVGAEAIAVVERLGSLLR